MKLENLTAEEATEIIQRGGVVKGCTMAIYTAKNADGIDDYHAPYRVVTPPPDAEPVVTAEELLLHVWGVRDTSESWIANTGLWEKLDELKAARKPKPVKLLSFDEAVQAIKEGRGIQVQEPWNSIPHAIETTRQPKRQTLNFLDLAERRGWPITEIDGYDKGRRVYDATEGQAK